MHMENSMICYTYHKNSWASFADGLSKEWVITNGLGSYGGSSLIGAHNRTHQGYLIASLHPPIERYLILSKINETLLIKNCSYDLETSQHLYENKTVYKNGQRFLKEFTYDGTVQYLYETAEFSLRKSIALKRGENVCAIAYECSNLSDEGACLSLLPLFNFRKHNDSSTAAMLQFDTSIHENALFLTPKENPLLTIRFMISEGLFCPHSPLYDSDMQLQTEVDLETEGLDCHFTPYEITIEVPPRSSKKISLLCDLVRGEADREMLPYNFIAHENIITPESAFEIIQAQKDHSRAIIKKAAFNDRFADSLVLAADHFICDRHSTGRKTILAGLPWFTDWGRDTMIAFTGLTLCTGRFEEAEEILLTFSNYIQNGIVPNMFPDDNASPLYNTADASLWYFIAVNRYLKYVNTKEAFDFIQTNIYPHLKDIVQAYQAGTDFHIYMAEDGLIHAGSDLDQITWMDVRVGEWVVTPRHGKPVEINALWYNALCIMNDLSQRFQDNDSSYLKLSEQVRASFQAEFWNPNQNCLYDVIEKDQKDDSLRPNQIYSIALPYSLLTSEQEKAVVATVYEELYIGCGLRSLSGKHPDYHGIYCGSLPKRDAAYHQGTAWSFLLGGFISAFLKINNHSAESIGEALTLLAPIRKHLTDTGCIGSISEIFDGDTPHTPRGCYAQAWSVGEILRAYTEDILPYLGTSRTQ